MSEIKLTGVVIACLPMQSGTSKTTGNPWAKQGFVLETSNDGQHVRKVRIDVIGAERLQRFAIQQGERITAYIDINAREYNGNYYNDVTAWKVEREQQGGSYLQSGVVAMPQQTGQTMTGQTGPQYQQGYQQPQQGYVQQPGYAQQQQMQGQTVYQQPAPVVRGGVVYPEAPQPQPEVVSNAVEQDLPF